MVRIAVVIPTRTEDMDLAIKTAKLHKSRAGFSKSDDVICDIYVREDSHKKGWVAMHNDSFKKYEFDYYVYSCALSSDFGRSISAADILFQNTDIMPREYLCRGICYFGRLCQ